MATLLQMKSNLSMRLNEPRPQKPSERVRWNAITRTTQSFFNRLSNTGRAWQVSEVNLKVTPNTQDYLLPISENFGKPLQVVTIDPSNPSHFERSIPFFELQNLDEHWGYPNDLGNLIWSPDGSPHTAMRMGFYRIDDNPYVRVKPIPKLTATYTVTYTIGNWVDSAGLDTSPVLSEHHDLITTVAALSILPHSEWSGDPKADAAMRADLRESLREDRATYMPDFEMYIRSLTKSRLNTRVGYGDD